MGGGTIYINCNTAIYIIILSRFMNISYSYCKDNGSWVLWVWFQSRRFKYSGFQSVIPTGNECNGFRCDDDTCIPREWKCDGYVDCKDDQSWARDELECNSE